MAKNFQVITLRSVRVQRGALEISREVASHLNVQEGLTILHVGKIHTQLKITVNNNRSGRFILLHPVTLSRLHLRLQTRYGIQSLDDGIHIGPVVGIMHEVSHDPARPFSGQGYFFSQLYRSARRLGEMCFVFDPNQINFFHRTVVGYSYVNRGWRKGVYPIPDVIYPREGGYNPAKLRIREKLESMGCRFFNPPLIGKWQTNKTLAQDLSLIQYLPETRLADNFSQIEKMLTKYGAVYVKPINGSQGKNIIKVTGSRHTNLYRYCYSIDSRQIDNTVRGLQSLRVNLKKIMGRRKYIVQQRINLLRVNGNITDVRVLVQKDENGRWTVTGKACRVGRLGSITSNISGGGSGYRLPNVLARHFSNPQVRTRIIQEIDYLALEAAKVLENQVSSIGELGIDIGIDTTGKLWFIEANLKPARKVFILIGAKYSRRASIMKPMQYSRYLAGFQPER